MATTIEDLDRRVTALEQAQNDTTQTVRWVVTKLGRISAVQDEHTLRLERIEAEVGEMKSELREVKTGLKSLREDLPSIVADALRDVLKER